MPSDLTLIQVRDLSKTFLVGREEVMALRQVSFSIALGEFIALTGSSGSGKSTLMYILGLIDVQSAGEYRYEGRITDSLSDAERSVLRNRSFGFIFQSFHLLPRATALRNVAMPLEYAQGYGARISSAEIERRARSCLEQVGLSDRVTHLPNQLSGGQRQRVAIARALVNDPRVIFADEPTGNLDSRNALEVLELFKRLNREGRTIVLVTHDRELASHAGRQIQMRDGKILEDTTHAPK